MSTGRLIIDPPADGGWNMAIDAAILESLKPNGPITLRFYSWSRPTVSLGYFQTLVSRQSHHASRDADLVRRTTGGGAIVHDRELTYSVAMPWDDRSPASTLFLYEQMHTCISDALHKLGVRAARFGRNEHLPRHLEPFLCFQRRTAEDLIVGGYKVVGSAQRRGGHGVLQHGSILLRSSPAAPELPGCLDLSPNPTLEGNAVRCLQESIVVKFGRSLGIRFVTGTESAEERASAAIIEQNRFRHPAWHARC